MQLTLNRIRIVNNSTIGELLIDGRKFCDTLEDVPRRTKIKGKTCIGTGTYRVILSFSNRFQRLLPEVLDVPEFAGIRIHSGNTSEDTEGCILVGVYSPSLNIVQSSRQTFARLFQQLGNSLTSRKVFLTINQPKDWPSLTRS